MAFDTQDAWRKQTEYRLPRQRYDLDYPCSRVRFINHDTGEVRTLGYVVWPQPYGRGWGYWRDRLANQQMIDGMSECRQDRIETKAARDLKEGDLVDLQDDPYADRGDEHPEFEFEYERVVGVERETEGCVRVDFANFSVGFPPDHVLRVQP